MRIKYCPVCKHQLAKRTDYGSEEIIDVYCPRDKETHFDIIGNHLWFYHKDSFYFQYDSQKKILDINHHPNHSSSSEFVLLKTPRQFVDKCNIVIESSLFI